MTDRIKIINAIKMVKHVADVQTHVADPDTYFAVEKARRELGDKLLAVLYPEKKK